ncbi:MAG: GNAT family N-acetyltransferase [Clostridia bacterium]|nr:GNAT family N-acetyltransferase [Clostridia bacterium]
MPISGILQPELIPVDDALRLRRYGGAHDFALPWYQDEETLWLLDGIREPYDEARLAAMYSYLDAHGELYWIEVQEGGTWRPVGDVTFWAEDMPIVIGDRSLRGRGIGLRVIRALTERGRSLGYPCLMVQEIYHYNEPSRRCFEKAGFCVVKTTDAGVTLRLEL